MALFVFLLPMNADVAFIPGLPVYGGLARSKINEYSGSKTLLSGVALAFFTFLAVQYLLEPLAWLPVSRPTY
jgi:MFS superfamily sulfate permease-like transporter